MDGRPNRRNKAAFSISSGEVWTVKTRPTLTVNSIEEG